MSLSSVDNEVVGTQDSSFSAIPSSATSGIQPQIPGNSSNIPQVLIGYQKDGFGTGKDQGIKVSKQGFDVNTATNNQLIMSSAFNSFKIVATGVATLEKPANQAVSSVVVPHGQPSPPIFNAYFAQTNGYTQLPYTLISSSTGAGTLCFYTESDATNITIQLIVPPASPYYGLDLTGISAISIRYYILVETAAA